MAGQRQLTEVVGGFQTAVTTSTVETSASLQALERRLQLLEIKVFSPEYSIPVPLKGHL
jgi:hypothetical protein